MATLRAVIKITTASQVFILLQFLLVFPSSSGSSLDSKSVNLHQSSSRNNLSINRSSRAAVEIALSDPLDCLSQLVCGLNTFPPRVPSQYTAVANDYAYLLRTVILRLKKLPREPPTPKPTNATITSTEKDDEEQNDDDSSEEDFNDDEDEASEEDETQAETTTKKPRFKSKNQAGDVANLFDLHPPFGLFRSSKALKPKKESKKKLQKAPVIPNPLQKLRMETNIREKLRSDAQCLTGILNHTCPFRYEELMVLMSGVLERQRVISYNTNKVLPMVGYLLKSRSLTETLRATFSALEKVNNVTITKDRNHEEIFFNNIYDEITRGEIGIGNGIRIVETNNDEASSIAWEDDEFDEALHNPFVKREEIRGYGPLGKNNTKKKTSSEEREDEEEEPSEENQRPPRPPSEDSLGIAILPGGGGRPQEDADYGEDSESQEDSSAFKDVPLPPLYGFMSQQKNSPKRHRHTNN